MALRIPTKSLEDNFKLNDFQKDFVELMDSLLLLSAQPKTVNINGRNEMEFIYDNGVRKVYRFIKADNKIIKIINLTDNVETKVNNN